jgi:hypothetical protein
MVDAADLKSVSRKGVWVRVPPSAPRLSKYLLYYYPVGVMEGLITAVEKPQPSEPAAYFLKGLNKSRMKHRLIEDEDT